MSFRNLALAPNITKALDVLGFEKPTEIQSKAIPMLLTAKKVDFHGQAQTGTGKTLAFGIPLIHTIDESNKTTQALIVAPTRELVVQICQSLRSVAQFMNISIEPVYGGVSMDEQTRSLKKGVHIVVGTPGRLNDHLRRRTLSLQGLKTLVLDEADIMLDMGFKEEVDEILKYASNDRQIWLFSATVKQGIHDIMQKHMKNPVSVRVSQQNIGTATTAQFFSVVPMRDRIAAVSRFIDSVPEFYGFIFCQTKILTAEVAEHLMRRGYKSNALHGDMSQVQRNRVIKRFKQKEFTILVATDVAARGIDVSDLTHVINYSLPDDQESYVHRIGRTGRAGKEGTAITFVSHSEVRHIGSLQRKFKLTINPLEVPTADTIAKVRIDQAAEYLETAVKTPEQTTSYRTQLLELVNKHSREELANAVAAFLDEKFLKYVNNDHEIKFSSSNQASQQAYAGNNSTNGSNDSGLQEIYLNVGSDDGLTKEEVIEFLKKNSDVQENQLEKLKVIKRRTFIVVPTAMVFSLKSALQGHTLGGRKVRVDVTNDDSFRTPTSSRGNSSFGGGNRRGKKFGGNGNGMRRSSDKREYSYTH
jgi:ATP-dependent RNA helicase DeaD